MKRKHIGTLLYYILWPLVWFYSPLRVRVRVLVRVDNDVLVVKNWFGPNTWQLPGGGMKFGESPVQTAQREIKEELNIELNQADIFMLHEEALIEHHAALLTRYQYAVVTLDSKPKVTLSSEITESNWAPITSIKLAPALTVPL
jgi:8-oxo-dGTP pyrophosphatase MutT (NUDIX family)